ncbi:ankyrin [Hypoxylon sp. FL1284]|nr:ankyrin [Hypoxylon sp. FL1284]
MASKTHKIPKESWERHKETIMSLYLTSDLSVEELVVAMDRDHGFNATLSQYEAQLRDWKARKNLKLDEWEVIFKRIDDLKSRGIQSRVTVSNHPIDSSRISRARRHSKRAYRLNRRHRAQLDPQQVASVVDGSVAVEVQNPDGSWTVHTDESSGDVLSALPRSVLDEIFEPNSQEDLVGTGTSLHSDVARPLASSDVTPRPSLVHTQDSVPFNFLADAEGIIFPGLMDLPYQNPPSSMHHEQDADIVVPPSELRVSSSQPNSLDYLSWPTFCLESLPFERFERDTALRSLVPQTNPSPMQDIRLLGSQTLANKFLLEIASAMPIASLTLRTLDAILPATQRLYSSSGGAQLSQRTIDDDFCRTLLFSLVNGFIGMKNIPLEMVPQDKPNHVTKALAENLFRAIILHGDHRAIRALLQTGLINLDTFVCFVYGQKYTPLEVVAKHHKYKAIRELLALKPDVNRTFRGPYINHGGVLGELISNFRTPGGEWGISHATFPLEFLDTVDALIEADAEIHSLHIVESLERFTRTELAHKLLENIAPARHHRLIFDGVLHCAAARLTDEEADRFITKCLSRYSEVVNSAIVIGVKRGHMQLAQTNIRYAKDLSQILSAAIKSGRNDLIQFVLDQNPDMLAPAATISAPDWSINRDYLTTPLAEAISARDEALVKELELRGSLQYLERGDRITAVFPAAASAGDVDYVKKLLLLCPQVEAETMRKAFSCAINNKQEEVARFLLDAGVNFRTGIPTPGLIIKQLYELGSMPLLSDFLSADPNACLSYDLLYSRILPEEILLEYVPRTKTSIANYAINALLETIDQNNVKALELLISCKAVDLKSITHQRNVCHSALGAAIIKDAETSGPDFPLTARLLDAGCDIDSIVCVQGVNGWDESLTPLLMAINTNSNNLVQFLIKRGTCVNKEASRGIKRTPIQAAAQNGRLDMVQLLLENGADVNGEPAYLHGRTALQCAAASGNCNIAALLLDHGALVSAAPAPVGGRWPIEAAAKHGRIDMIEFLWKASLCMVPIEQCRKAMELAEENGHSACVDLIRELAVLQGITPTLEGNMAD